MTTSAPPFLRCIQTAAMTHITFLKGPQQEQKDDTEDLAGGSANDYAKAVIGVRHHPET
jgi:hypothetical protein